MSRYAKALIFTFIISLPLVNPIIHGDGVGYYAYLRAPLVDHNLDFEKDWWRGNESFVVPRTDAKGQLDWEQRTATGRITNLFSVGPAMLWVPALAIVHGAILGLKAAGANISADGFGLPYRLAMALSTAIYGFAGVLFGFLIARQFAPERWAFLATMGIWLASSLPVYMYFNPSWSHAHSAFTVGLFLWRWHATGAERPIRDWLILGLIAGLMINVYFVNATVLVVLLIEGFYRRPAVSNIAVFFSTLLLALTPTFITRQIIFGSPLSFGMYSELRWNWLAPAAWAMLFSSFHGAFSWTPVLLPATAGVLLVRRADPALGWSLIAAVGAFFYAIACYPYWHGISSFGNRFFVSLTPIFVLGLAMMLSELGRYRALAAAIAVLALWNFGFIFQWGTHMLPARESISWREMVRNQVTAVPERITGVTISYFTARSATMREIERKDVERRKREPRWPRR
jgi:hypothetical protein